MKKSYLLLMLFGCTVSATAQTISIGTSERGFIENKGQVHSQNYLPNPDVQYLYHMPGLNVQLRTHGFSYDTYTFTETIMPGEGMPGILPNKQLDDNIEREYSFHRIDIDWVGGNPSPEIIPEQPANDHLNVYNALVPNGINGLRHFGKVTYKNIYPGIDLEFIASPSSNKPIEYNFIVHPGADASLIKFKYSGTNKVYLADGKLVIATAAGDLTESIPASYLAGSKQPVEVNYVIESGMVGFEVGKYDGTEILIIDPMPTISWARKYGSSNSADINNGWTDSTGIYIVAASNASSTDFLATAGAFQTTEVGGIEIFLAKFNLDGVLQWATFYGGAMADYGNHIVSDHFGNVSVIGYTTSPGLATPGSYQNYISGQRDALLVQFDSTGRRLWATYLGGSSSDQGINIDIDKLGHIFISGTSFSSGLASPGAHQDTVLGIADIFLAKFNAQGVYQWSTYFGGEMGEVDYEVVCDTTGNVFLTGSTASSTQIATLGSFQPQNNGSSNEAFIAKFSSAGQLLWSTYYGGSSSDVGEGMVIDKEQNVLLAGTTMSPNLPMTASSYSQTLNGGQDNFCVKFSNDGDYIWSTFYGGSDSEEWADVGTNEAGDILLGGGTFSSTGIALSGAVQPVYGGSKDMYMAAFNRAGGIKWASYYGGSNGEQLSAITGLGRDVYMIGFSTSSTLPQIGFSAGNGGVRLLKLEEPCKWSIPAVVTSASCSHTANGAINLNPTGGVPPYMYIWSTGDTARTLSNLSGGMYTVSVIDNAYCILDTTITVPAPKPIATSINATICNGQTLLGYGSSGNYTDTYVAASGCDSVRTLNLQVIPYLTQNIDTQLCYGERLVVGNHIYSSTGIYIDTIATGLCETIVRSKVTVMPGIIIPLAVFPASCGNSADGTAILMPMGGIPPYSYLWATGDTVPILTNLTAGQYSISVIDNAGCVVDTNITVNASTPSTHTQLLDTICTGQTVEGYGITGNYIDTFTVASGCDSIRVLKLQVLPYLVQTQDVRLCNGDSLIVGHNVYTSNGAYTDTITGSGCQTIVHSNVTVLPAILSGTINGDNIADTFSQYIYTVPFVAGADYEWDANDANLISGQGTNSVILQWLPSNGSLWLYVGLNGCTDTLLKKVFINLNGTGIAEASETSVNVYPNPTENRFSIEMPHMQSGDVKVALNTITGANIWIRSISHKVTEYDITDLASGVYLLQIKHRAFTQVVRIVKY